MDDLFVCLGIVGTLVVIFGFILLMRYINYKETLALAEKGLARPEQPRPGRALLRWGIVITGVGAALTLGLLPIGFSTSGQRYPLGLGPWMLAGLIPLFLGLSLVLIHYLSKNDS